MKIYNLKDREEYLEEVCILEHNEWGSIDKSIEDRDNKVNKKIKLIKDNFDNRYFCKLILLDKDKLVGFISLFPFDTDERKDLSPWYATIYVKEEYRGKGYSKLLNDAIIKEAKDRGFNKIYLKTELDNYYEKFGAIYLDKLSTGEKLYYIDIK